MSHNKFSESEKILTIFKQSNIAAIRHLERIGVAILSISETGKFKEIGSGTCIKYNDIYLIATAAHVIMNSTPENLHIVHSRNFSPIEVNPISLHYKGGGQLDNVDIGWLRVKDSDAALMEKEFIRVERIASNVNHVPDDLVVLNGYPGQLWDLDETEMQSGVMPIGYHTITLDVEEMGGNPMYDIYLDYPEDTNVFSDGNIDYLPDAPGLSGGGIWSVNINKQGTWSAHDMKLIAIDHRWEQNKRYVRGTQIQHWLNLVASDFPTNP